jgi:hypothetical protein
VLGGPDEGPENARTREVEHLLKKKDGTIGEKNGNGDGHV